MNRDENICIIYPIVAGLFMTEMVNLIRDSKRHPYFLGIEFTNVVAEMLCSPRLLDNSSINNDVFYRLIKVYFPHYVEAYFETFSLTIHHPIHKKEFLRCTFACIERVLFGCLLVMDNEWVGDAVDNFKTRRVFFGQIVQAVSMPLHDDSTTAELLHFDLYAPGLDHFAIFTLAVRLGLVEEATLLYHTGAVGNKELTALAQSPFVRIAFADKGQPSAIAQFLRGVLNKPRRLQSLAILRVSRLLGEDLPKREERADQLELTRDMRQDLLFYSAKRRYMAAVKARR
ncbi:hypothetical protein ACOMHN_054512 [Nucella lapillus]